MSLPKPLPKFPETTLEDVLDITPIPGNSTLYKANIPRDWCSIWAAFGGISAGLIHAAARLYSQTHHPKNPQPDPLNSHVQFLHPVPPGAVRLSLVSLKSGSRVSVVQVSLQVSTKSKNPSPNQHQSEEWRTCVLGIITQGNLSIERGLSIPIPLPFPKDQIPDRKKECVVGEHPRWYIDAAPMIAKFETWMPKFGDEEKVEAYGNPRFGRETREIWLRRRDGKSWDVLSLGLLCDYFDGAPGNFSPDRLDTKANIWYPTLCLTTEIKSDPKGKKWLYLRARAGTIKNGRFDTLVWVLDEERELMAIAKHVTVATEGKFAGKVEEMKSVYKL
ncbi:hypothetical protein EG329_000688 [Mollisiaceae sp. DMI_Dod_QoI]|nr:hypothetical protein EG329_000688 [Helotiales sp. DMI_Dod_QoI]